LTVTTARDPTADDPLPQPPARPEPEDCCYGGCDRCVFDVYEEARERYEAALRAWRARHPAQAPHPGAGDAPPGA
jgi:hypothetical protein